MTFLQWVLAGYSSFALRWFVVAIGVVVWAMLIVFIGWLFEIDQDKRPVA